MPNDDRSVTCVALPSESRVSRIYETMHLADAFEVRLPHGAITDPESLARFALSQQAPWVAGLMRVRDTLVAGFGLKTAKQLQDPAATGGDKRIHIFKVYETGTHEVVKADQKCGKCLPGASRGRDQHMLARADRRPGTGLRLGRRAEVRGKPAPRLPGLGAAPHAHRRRAKRLLRDSVDRRALPQPAGALLHPAHRPVSSLDRAIDAAQGGACRVADRHAFIDVTGRRDSASAPAAACP